MCRASLVSAESASQSAEANIVTRANVVAETRAVKLTVEFQLVGFYPAASIEQSPTPQVKHLRLQIVVFHLSWRRHSLGSNTRGFETLFSTSAGGDYYRPHLSPSPPTRSAPSGPWPSRGDAAGSLSLPAGSPVWPEVLRSSEPCPIPLWAVLPKGLVRLGAAY